MGLVRQPTYPVRIFRKSVEVGNPLFNVIHKLLTSTGTREREYNKKKDADSTSLFLSLSFGSSTDRLTLLSFLDNDSSLQQTAMRETMASLGGDIGNISLPVSVTRTLADLNLNNNTTKSIITSVAVLACLAAVSYSHLSSSSLSSQKKSSKYDEDDDEVDSNPNSLKSLLLFCYSCFLKPHATAGETGTQQDALESFYGSQAGIYDATRGTLLKGREDMLALVAAQLRYRAGLKNPIWVDVLPPHQTPTRELSSQAADHGSI